MRPRHYCYKPEGAPPAAAQRHPRAVTDMRGITMTVGRSASQDHNSSRRLRYDRSHPEGPSPDGPESARRHLYIPGPSGDGPSGATNNCSGRTSQTTAIFKRTQRHEPSRTKAPLRIQTQSKRTLRTKTIISRIKTTKNTKGDLTAPSALPFPSRTQHPLLSINKNGTIHAELKTLQ